MKKWTALLLALSLLLCGCAAQEAPEQTTAPQATAAPTQPTAGQTAQMPVVELTLWVTEENLWTDEAQLDALLEEFNAYYPNILVTVEHVSGEQVGSRVPNLVLADSEQLARWWEQGLLTDLTELWTEDDVYDNVKAACGDGGSYFALPLCVVADCMAIRQSAFTQAQAMPLINQVSRTWSPANFLQAASNLYDSGLENSLSIYCKNTGGDVYTRLLVENYGGGSYVNTINGAYQLDSAPMVNALQAISTAKGIVIRPDQTADDAMADFLNGKTAMTLNWDSALQLEHGADGEIIYMLYPSGGRAGTYARVYGLGVFANADVHQQAASMTLIGFLNGSEAAVRTTGQLPARRSQVDIYDGTGLEQIMDELSLLLSHMKEGEVPGKNWELGRSQWVQLLQQIPGLSNQDAEGPLTLADLIAACQEKLS